MLEPVATSDLTALRRNLFAGRQPPERVPTGEVQVFSAPGEGRECVEIARRIVQEARSGVRFDRIAVVLRSTADYVGLLEDAFDRAGIPGWFERGARRPHPGGRAFLAMLACAVERLSAIRFAEYLSLGQVPDGEEAARAPEPAMPADDAVTGFARVEAQPEELEDRRPNGGSSEGRRRDGRRRCAEGTVEVGKADRRLGRDRRRSRTLAAPAARLARRVRRAAARSAA